VWADEYVGEGGEGEDIFNEAVRWAAESTSDGTMGTRMLVIIWP
jgi:hypothetical protein